MFKKIQSCMSMMKRNKIYKEDQIKFLQMKNTLNGINNRQGLRVHHQLPEFTQTHVHWAGEAIQTSHLLSSPPPAFTLSQHQSLFKWVNSFQQVAKYWSFSFSNSASNEYSGLVSFWMDWLDLLTVQGTLKTLLQNHSLKASILRLTAFFL